MNTMVAVLGVVQTKGFHRVLHDVLNGSFAVTFNRPMYLVLEHIGISFCFFLYTS